MDPIDRTAIRPRLRVAILASLILGGPAARGDEVVALEERLGPEATTAARIDLKASGLYRPPLPPDSTGPDVKMPKPLDVEIETRVVYRERLLPGPARRSARLVRQAASAINGEIRPTARQLRPELALLIASRREVDGSVVVVSPSGSLTRGELELVEALGDTLCLADLLPEKPVKKGDAWTIRKTALWAITGYDAVATNNLQGTVESISDDAVSMTIKGDVKGSFLAAEGTMTCDGRLVFDRRAGLVTGLDLDRTESRAPGAVEAGLDLKSKLQVRRAPAEPTAELADAALAKLSPEITPARLLLQLIAPDGRYNLLHDRSWHTYWDDRKLVVLKRFEGGRVDAQCNLIYGPPAAKGKHQDVKEFESDVKRALGRRFGHVVGGGEVDGDPQGGFRYKIGIQGRQDDLGLVWYYYLIASPRGDQLLATFTLVDSDAATFGQADEAIVGSLQWNDPPLDVGR
jgi:hypothetical protein